ncbi:MAG: hypothetical protein IKM33_06895 [Clostridia bacterium]|nr:hypothetical protein [Clostridia bacterium]
MICISFFGLSEYDFKFGFVGQGLCPCTPPETLLANILASLGANLPAAKFARVSGLLKTFKKYYLLKVFEIPKNFLQKVLWRGPGAEPLAIN